MRRQSPSHKSSLFGNAIANIPRGGGGPSHNTRSRSVFERLDRVPAEAAPVRRRTVRASSPYGHRRVTMDMGRPQERSSSSWRHDRYEKSPMSSNGPQSTVFVRGLNMDVSEGALRGLFEDAGCEVSMVKIERAPLTTAVVGFARRDHAGKAVEKVHGHRLMGARIRVMVWNRDDGAAIKALQDRRAMDREEELQMKQELMQMQRNDSSRLNTEWSSPRSGATMAHLAPKQSVFERVS